MPQKTSEHRSIYFKILAIGFVIGSLGMLTQSRVQNQAKASDQIWDIQAIDTMKVSRDKAREDNQDDNISKIVDTAAALNPTHISIGTPYDEEFYEILQEWSFHIHQTEANVWFRGNFSGWEGWFGYELLESAEDHHQMVHSFITSNPDLFEDGDIFTPVPEPENGLIGDPRWNDAEAYKDFLIKSYENCRNAVSKIRKDVTCGYFGTNGDIAKEIFTAELVEALGGIVVIDHYVRDPETYESDINYLSEKLQAPIIIGEFGAPVPDIHGDLNQEEQAEVIDSYLKVFHKMNDQVFGLNYWVLQDGSTAIADSLLNTTPTYDLLQRYYAPKKYTLEIENTLGSKLSNIQVTTLDQTVKKQSNSQGTINFLSPDESVELSITGEEYDKKIVTVSHLTPTTIVLEQTYPSWWYRLREKVHQFFKSRKSNI